jgi:beta-N-acetylhexosaminidase
MSTHLIASALDDYNMATFSSEVINHCLRGDLNYNGVIISDDLCMGGVANEYTPGERALYALKSGHDLIMFCHHPQDQKKAFEAVLNSLNSDQFSAVEIDSKLTRISKLKQRLQA